MSSYREAGKKLIASGCLSERYHEELFSEMPEVDGFIGVNEYEQFPELLKTMEQRRDWVSGCHTGRLERLPRNIPKNPYSAAVKIAEGCDNRCAYCIIPSIRGSFRSKRKEDVIQEAEELAKAGCKELILIAQDVTDYRIDLYGKRVLPELLRELCKVDGIHWIRLMYYYEDRISDDLSHVMASKPKICHYIDIPLQHCSDKILRRMRRRSTKASIMETIEKLRRAIPDIHIRTTFIVGFPGEEESDYDQLCDFVESVKLERLGVFAYSQEENTPAGEMKEQIPQDVKEERLDGIMRRQLEISLQKNQQKLGKVLEVLVESQEEDRSYVGRTMYDAPEIDNAVIFTSERELNPGDFVKVLVKDAFDYDLAGVEVTNEFTK